MSSGKLLHGQQLDNKKNVITQYTQREMDKAAADALLGTAATEIDPTDQGSSLVRTFTVPSSGLEAYSKKISVHLNNVNIPDRLTGITVTHSKVKGSGVYSTPNAGTFAIGSNPNYGLSLDGNAQANCSIQTEITAQITRFWPHDVRATVYVFFLTGSVTEGAIITKINAIDGSTVLNWPRFNPVDVNLTVISQEVNLRVQVDVKQFVSLGDPLALTFGEGGGNSQTLGTNIRTIVIPNTIHPSLTIATPSEMDHVDVSASVGWPEGVNFPARSSVQNLSSQNIIGSVSPTTISATTPNNWPTTGKYLYRVDQQEEEWGYTQIAATVIDFANL